MKTARQTFKIGDRVRLKQNGKYTGTVAGFYRGDVYAVKIKMDGGKYTGGYGVDQWAKAWTELAEKSFLASQPVTANSTPSLSVELAVITVIPI